MQPKVHFCVIGVLFSKMDFLEVFVKCQFFGNLKLFSLSLIKLVDCIQNYVVGA